MIRYEMFYPTVDLKDIHPDDMYKKELGLAKKFVVNAPSSKKINNCPISGLERQEILFEKWGQSYALCSQTWSLSLGNLPDELTLNHYFFDSDLAELRSSESYQSLNYQLRKDLWLSQIDWIEGRIRRYKGMFKYKLIDWGPKMLGWLQEIKKAEFISEYVVAEPLPPLSANGYAEEAEVVVLFDVIQRYTRPASLLSSVYGALKPGGLLLLTCRSGSGFDVLTLAEESESIFPFDHICLPSPQGICTLLKANGFEVVELTTPGLLDVQLVNHAGNKIPLNQRFQRHLINCDEQVKERFQCFLQQNNLSSHLRVVAKKPE